ncbi:MAG: dephospho-CoA kinase [Acidobacteriota bacterium]
MIRIVLSGGIATGKSMVGRELRAAGLAVIDADQVARELVQQGTPGLGAVVERFGRDVLTPEGRLDRPALGRLVFGDAAARADLERILHPLVRRAIEAFFTRLAPGVPGVAEIPLAYETGWVSAFDTAVVTACRPATQRARLMARDRLSDDEAEQRLAAQWPIEDKARLADGVVLTEGTVAETIAQAGRLADWLRGRSRPS